MAYTVEYTASIISAGDTDIIVTVSTTPNGDGSYSVTAVSGTFAGNSIDGLTTGDGADNEEFDPNSTTNVIGGVDSNGVAFSYGGGAATAVIWDDGGALEWLVNGNSGALTLASSDVPCFLRGTRIATEHGETAVEDLAAGDLVRTLEGALLPVRWIGTRRYLRHPLASVFWNDVSPIRIEAGAIADNVPSRDLYVSPDHSLYLAGHLINAKNLINGTSIARDTSLRDIEYFHIELDRHEAILAENTPAETYLDNGNAAQWRNAEERPGNPSAPAAPDAWYAPHAFGRDPVLAKARAAINARVAEPTARAA